MHTGVSPQEVKGARSPPSSIHPVQPRPRTSILALLLAALLLATLAAPCSAAHFDITRAPPARTRDGLVVISGSCYADKVNWSEERSGLFQAGCATGLSVRDGHLLLEPGLYVSPLNDGGPVITAGAVGSWDRYLHRSCLVIVDGVYHLYFDASEERDWASTRRIGLATSPDGVNWTKRDSPVLELGPGAYDALHVKAPRVVVEGGAWSMLYTGTRTSTDENICLATSADGVNWTKHPSNPVLRHGAGNLDGYYLLPTDLARPGADYQLRFKAGGPSGECSLGMATSPDLVEWTRVGPLYTCPAEGWHSGYMDFGQVEGGPYDYGMWVSGGETDAFSVGWLTSPDGLEWTDRGSPVLEPTEGTPYAHSLEVPNVVDLGGRYLLVVRCIDEEGAFSFAALDAVPWPLSGNYESILVDSNATVLVDGVEWDLLPGSMGTVGVTVRMGDSPDDLTGWGPPDTVVRARYVQYRVDMFVDHAWQWAGVGNVRVDVTVTVESVEWRVDDGEWQPTEGPPEDWTARIELPDGRHNVAVKAVDSGGAVSTMEWTVTVERDLQRPCFPIWAVLVVVVVAAAVASFQWWRWRKRRGTRPQGPTT